MNDLQEWLGDPSDSYDAAAVAERVVVLVDPCPPFRNTLVPSHLRIIHDSREPRGGAPVGVE